MAKNEITKITEQPEYGYYSKLLKKDFDTVDELVAAESEYKKAEAEKQNAIAVKKTKAEEIEKAYQDYLDVRKEAKEIIVEAQNKASELIKEAENKYYELRNEFIKTYGSFHQSYYSDGNKEIVSISDFVDSIFKDFWRW